MEEGDGEENEEKVDEELADDEKIMLMRWLCGAAEDDNILSEMIVFFSIKNLQYLYLELSNYIFYVGKNMMIFYCLFGWFLNVLVNY